MQNPIGAPTSNPKRVKIKKETTPPYYNIKLKTNCQDFLPGDIVSGKIEISQNMNIRMKGAASPPLLIVEKIEVVMRIVEIGYNKKERKARNAVETLEGKAYYYDNKFIHLDVGQTVYNSDSVTAGTHPDDGYPFSLAVPPTAPPTYNFRHKEFHAQLTCEVFAEVELSIHTSSYAQPIITKQTSPAVPLTVWNGISATALDEQRESGDQLLLPVVRSPVLLQVKEQSEDSSSSRGATQSDLRGTTKREGQVYYALETGVRLRHGTVVLHGASEKRTGEIAIRNCSPHPFPIKSITIKISESIQLRGIGRLQSFTKGGCVRPVEGIVLEHFQFGGKEEKGPYEGLLSIPPYERIVIPFEFSLALTEAKAGKESRAPLKDLPNNNTTRSLCYSTFSTKMFATKTFMSVDFATFHDKRNGVKVLKIANLPNYGNVLVVASVVNDNEDAVTAFPIAYQERIRVAELMAPISSSSTELDSEGDFEMDVPIDVE
ncbi:hypothetical protein ADEAN_000589200 [Angomonas deanei]|uniref:Uncharacterized protein n=1 Tax=Angomonas deanei TaxID=59799 RepID=A0A7G2CHL6_9TRYP|nr:hypothetical protein ADEAN_000589200 [Angomonas deanei]